MLCDSLHFKFYTKDIGEHIFFSNFVKGKIIKKKTHSKKLAPILIQKSETKWMV